MSAEVLDTEDGRRDAPVPAGPHGGRDGTPSDVLLCPACGSTDVAQVLGDNGGVSYVCTTCGHSWS
jgi:hypothetical protein